MDTSQALIVAGVFMLAGTVKGVTGMGLPTVAISLLGFWMSPAHAAALLVLPSLVTNIAQCRGPHARVLVARLWPLWLALAVVTVFTPDVGRMAAGVDAHRLLGGVLVAYGVFGLWRPVLPHLPQPSAWLGASVGAVTGLVVAATAVFVMPMVPFLQSLRLEKDALVQALGLSFMVATLALAVRVQGSSELLFSLPSLLALGMAIIGLQLGTRLRDRISAPTFQRVLFIVFIGLGLSNLLRAA